MDAWLSYPPERKQPDRTHALMVVATRVRCSPARCSGMGFVVGYRVEVAVGRVRVGIEEIVG